MIRPSSRASCVSLLPTAAQVSDWSRRPLSARQLSYAALDAHVLLQLFAALCPGLPDAAAATADATSVFQVYGCACWGCRVL